MAAPNTPRNEREQPEAGLAFLVWLIAAWLALFDLVLWFCHSVFGA